MNAERRFIWAALIAATVIGTMLLLLAASLDAKSPTTFEQIMALYRSDWIGGPSLQGPGVLVYPPGCMYMWGTYNTCGKSRSPMEINPPGSDTGGSRPRPDGNGGGGGGAG